MSRTLRNIMRRARDKFKVPKKVQDILPVKMIWTDGIFLSLNLSLTLLIMFLSVLDNKHHLLSFVSILLRDFLAALGSLPLTGLRFCLVPLL